ncbi:FAD-dependent monooxygenase [Spiractinospora alimapuensis]|uniref:FAD-dependent oxidoreductase n=1 Tax=Spiractinospora alimapuensis TaxID=2820884 RepID=UPI001F22D639|nr:FAD-dependent monooxygenase [Spiractinospora alimapuensis]QVQ54164.1 FAD-dependent monooxygenase [Spiractinospora alimapuensis]
MDLDSSNTPVVIIGAGPVGLSLALGLAHHGVHSVLLERRSETSERSKAPALHTRTREILRQWGIADALEREGTLVETMNVHSPAGRRQLTLDFTELAHEALAPGILFLEQAATERILLAAVRASGYCDVRFGAEVTALENDADAVHISYRSGDTQHHLTGRFGVGCDGASSFVRSSLGLSFDGATLPLRASLADVRVDDTRDTLPWPRTHNGSSGIIGAQRLAPHLWRIVRVEPGAARSGTPVPDAEVRSWVDTVLGAGSATVLWANRFQFNRRTSHRFRVGRVLLAGDAAHVFPPVMGQGMNSGIQDVHNLAWKLAEALDGGDHELLLASYDEERRHAIGAVSRYVAQQTRIGVRAPRPLRIGLVWLMRIAMGVPAMRRRSLGNIAMTDRSYGASALLDPQERAAGVRLPNPELLTPTGDGIRLYDLLPTGGALVHLDPAPAKADNAPEVDGLPVVRIGPDGYTDPSGLLRRLLGSSRGWIRVRPDRHVSWARAQRPLRTGEPLAE